MENSNRLENKVALITGAASGQGHAAARLFAAAGAKVVAADIDGEGAEKVVAQIQADSGEAVSVSTDISREAEVKAMIERAMEEYGRLDILFNNAGVGFSASSRFTMASVVDTPEEDWDAILAINLKGAAMGCKHAIPVMERQGGGVIVNNASINALVAMPGADAYTAAKGGIVALTRVLAADWGPKGIRVNCMCPAGVETPMIAPVLADEQVASSMRESAPLGRLAQPEEMAQVALFLASDEASYLNGAVIPVDGGWTCALRSLDAPYRSDLPIKQDNRPYHHLRSLAPAPRGPFSPNSSRRCYHRFRNPVSPDLPVPFRTLSQGSNARTA